MADRHPVRPWLAPLGEALREVRESRGFTQAETTKMLRISSGRISEMEFGIHPMPESVFYTFIDIFECEELVPLYDQAMEVHRAFVSEVRRRAGSVPKDPSAYWGGSYSSGTEWLRERGFLDQAPPGWGDAAWDRVFTEKSKRFPGSGKPDNPWHGVPMEDVIYTLEDFGLEVFDGAELVIEEFEDEDWPFADAPMRYAPALHEPVEWKKPKNVVAEPPPPPTFERLARSDRLSVPLWWRIDPRLGPAVEQERIMRMAQKGQPGYVSLQDRVIYALKEIGPDGATSAELAEYLNKRDSEAWSGNRASATLSNLLDMEMVARLTEQRGKPLLNVHVYPDYVEGRETTGRRRLKKHRRSPNPDPEKRSKRQPPKPPPERKIKLKQSDRALALLDGVERAAVAAKRLEFEVAGTEVIDGSSPPVFSIPHTPEQAKVLRVYWIAHDEGDQFLKYYLQTEVVPKLE